MTISTIEIGIIDYPGVMQSSLHGLREMFLLANKLCEPHEVQQRFSVGLFDIPSIQQSLTDMGGRKGLAHLQIVIIPPCVDGDYYLSPDQGLKDWILAHHSSGGIVCSACAGAFILAQTGLLHNRQATTHWNLASAFVNEFPSVSLDINKILINDGDIITAAGLMSWVDLGLELVAQFMHPKVMRQLGRIMVVDTGRREQRYYQSFYPRLNHGDQAILKAQHYLQQHFHEPFETSTLSELSILTGRTFLRRFIKATGLKPIQYLQRLRIQKACDLMESSNMTFESIALKVGYEDTSAFRKTFLKIVGLTPRDFRSRFAAY
jgi:transcriptional regulator GlxA family with amidase domain